MATDTKVHWTQRPENKAKLKAMLKRASKSRKSKKSSSSTKVVKHGNARPEEVPEGTFQYALGYFECWIENFAQSSSVSATALASQLGKALSGKHRR